MKLQSDSVKIQDGDVRKMADGTLSPDREKQAEALRELAVFQMAHGSFPVAEKMTRIALWLAPENARNWRVRAYCLARMNSPREALKLLSQARSKGVVGIGIKDLFVVGFAFAKAGFLSEARRLLLSSGRA